MTVKVSNVIEHTALIINMWADFRQHKEFIMLFVLYCTDHEGSVEQRLATRPAHVERLEKLYAEGRLITAGAMPKDRDNPTAGFYGSIMIVDFESQDALNEWLKDEPFVHAGVYSHIDVKPFNKAFPKG